ncbi:Uncharacterised protein at_DN0327 [Pycnogonum litorale]
MVSFTGIGTLVAAISALIFTISGLFIKKMAGRVDIVIVYFLRMCITAFSSLIIVCVKRNVFWRQKLSDYVYTQMIVIGVLLQLVSLYYAYGILPLGDVICIASSSPLFIITARAFIYRRIPSILEISMIVFISLGVILCAQPNFIFTYFYRYEETKSLIYYLPAVVSAIGYSVTQLSFERISKDVEVTATMSIFGLVSACIASIYLLITDGFKIHLNLNDSLYLCAACITSHIAATLSLISVRIENSLMASIGRVSDIIFSFIFDFFLFNTVPNILTITGATMIFFGLLLPAIKYAIANCLRKRLSDNSNSVN